MTDELACRRARRTIHEQLDGDRLDAARLRSLEEHVDGCSSCAGFRDEMLRIHAALRDVPDLQMPDAALREVWRRTTGSAEGTDANRSPLGWRALAAAAVLAVAAVGLWVWNDRQTVEPPPAIARNAPIPEAEVRRAAQEARMVLGLTSDALRTTEQAAIRGVLGREVSGALQRVPISWPRSDAAGRGTEL